MKNDPKSKRDLVTGEVIEKETFEQLHDKPLRTRREFLSAGLIQMTASVTLPSVLSILARSGNARAQEIVCAKGGNTTLVPFITINLSGGAGLASNFVPHDQGMQLLNSYNKLGLGSASSLPIVRDFANEAPFAGNNISQFYVGMAAAADPTTILNSVFVGAPVRTQDDSSENKLNLEGMVAKAGRSGTILPHLGSNRNAYAYITPPNPLQVRRFSTIESALSIGGRLGEKLSKNQQAKLFSAIEKLTTSQTRNIASYSGGAELNQLINCATKDNTELVGTNDPGVNPIGDANYMGLWGDPDMNSDTFTQAAIVYNVIKGHAACGTISLGGYDYHNGTRTSGDTNDLIAGTLVGRVLQSFAAFGVKGFIAVTTDGAVTGPASETAGSPWTSDRGAAGMAYMLAYDPSGAKANGFQMGHFLPKQGQQAVDQTFVTSGTPEKLSAGIFANYLSFSGQIELLETILPREFSAKELDLILKIES